MHKNIVSLPACGPVLNRQTPANPPRAWSTTGALLAVLALAAPCARAQDSYTYTGTNGTAAAPSTGTTFAGAFTDTTANTFNVSPASPAGTLTFGGGATTYTAVDDIALTLNGGLAFTNTSGTVTINAGGGTVTAGTATLGFALGAGDVAFAPAINLGTNALAFTGGAAGQATTVSGVISGTGGVTYGSTGTLTLSGNNTYTGGTVVNGGTVVLNKGGGTGTVQGAVTVNTGATLNLATGDAIGYNAGGAVTAVNVNGGTVTSVAGNNEGYLTSFNLTGGTVAAGSLFRFNVNAATPPGITSLASATTSTFAANIDDFPGAGTAGTLTVNVAKGTTTSGVDLTISGVIQQTGQTAGLAGLTKTGAGYLNLTGASTFSGNVAINAGTVNLGAGGADGGASSALGATTGKTITVASGATLSFTANNAFGRGATNTALPTITVNSGGTLLTTRYNVLGAVNLNGGTMTSNDVTDVNNFQAYQLRGNVTVGGTVPSTIASLHSDAVSGGVQLDLPTTFTVNSTGTTGADLTVSAPLRNRSGDYSGFPGGSVGGLTKAGAGTMLLTAASTYTGATTVNAGSLFVSGSLAAGSAVTVSNAGTVFGGTGTVGGAVALNTGATLTAGITTAAAPAVGNLNTGALTLATGSTFNALVTNANSFSTLNAAGTTVLGNAAFSITLAGTASFANGTVLQLITSSVSGAFTNSVYTAGGYSFTADYNTDPGFFDVDVATAAVPEPSTIRLCAGLLIGFAGVARCRQIKGRRNGVSI